jgi:lipid-binding SYLF domain-containing protein
MIRNAQPLAEKGGRAMRPRTRAATVMALATGLLLGCRTVPATKEGKDQLLKDAAASRQEWNKLDPGVDAFAKKGYGYALFPEITKGGAGIGGAYGRGVVYEQGQHIGYADLTEGSLGLQLGGQTYSELIVFENKAAMDRFKAHQFSFGANASAVVPDGGTAASTQFVDGVAVFVRPITGVMGEAAVGGQKIRYVPN